ncbi:MAG: hypothetical protein U5N56_03245 [Candidatus Marinimicrobia bacterium]|nr:hypothetical protein [Candidatus Neomarinimicrobiota bacterium]
MTEKTISLTATTRAGESGHYQIILSLCYERAISAALLTFILIFTLIYGTLEDPFIYSFSNIGNYFPYRELYIFWGFITGFTLYFSVISLFKLENYQETYARLSILGVPFFITVTAMIPSLGSMPFWRDVHRWTTFFFVMCMIFSIHPFLLDLADRKPYLSPLLMKWQFTILAGCMLLLILQGQTGMFELWFFVMTCSLLIYLVWFLFSEALEKINVSPGDG